LTSGPSWQTTPVSFAIIAITVGIFVIGYVSPDADRWLFDTFALIRPGKSGFQPEVYRIFTVALLHAGLMHILFNMYAMWIFGPRLEMQVGSPAFASLYIASAGAGGFASVALGSVGFSVGASGAIFGLFGAWMFVAWKMRHSPGGRAMFNQLGILMAINILIPFLQPQVDWLGHAGGFTAGVSIAALWSVFAVGKPNARSIRTIIGTAAIVVSVIATFLVI
jgi:membrane associated rhomboid family serine protease